MPQAGRQFEVTGENCMSWTTKTALAAAIIVGVVLSPGGLIQVTAQTRQIPKFEVDPTWPKVPSKWVLGLVSGVSVDSRDHIWVLHRPKTVLPDQKDKAAPAL